MSASGEEIEAKLILVAAAPQRLADELAALPSIAEHRLLAAREISLRDAYLDTPERSLGRRGVALRVRRRDGVPWLALKGPDRGSGVVGAVRRQELELPFSDPALERIFAELRGCGLAFASNAAPGTRDPLAALRAHGLGIIQERDARRRLRDALDSRGRVCAELAIDCVRHRLGARDVLLYEVEVEARGTALDALRAIVAGLLATYGRALRAWPHDKLVTGLTLRRIHERGALDALLRADGSLAREGYTKIDHMLRAEET